VSSPLFENVANEEEGYSAFKRGSLGSQKRKDEAISFDDEVKKFSPSKSSERVRGLRETAEIRSCCSPAIQ